MNNRTIAEQLVDITNSMVQPGVELSPDTHSMARCGLLNAAGLFAIAGAMDDFVVMVKTELDSLKVLIAAEMEKDR